MRSVVSYVLTALAALLWTSLVGAQEIHSTHCLYGCPLGGAPTNDLIVRDIYILSSNDRTKLADWAAYRVTKDTIGPTQPRTWKADPLLDDSETLEPDDYQGAYTTIRVDRGHQVPLASFTGTPYWRDTNYLSNITPQKSDLNQGPWQRLESAVRALAQAVDTEGVYVMTGPLYERAMPSLPNADEAHVVPSGYWKIVGTRNGSSAKIAAFIFEQETPRGENFCNQIVTVRVIEQRSDFDFFHSLDASSQNTLETGLSVLAPALGCTP